MHTMDMVMTYGAVCLYKDMLLSCEKQVGITCCFNCFCPLVIGWWRTWNIRCNAAKKNQLIDITQWGNTDKSPSLIPIVIFQGDKSHIHIRNQEFTDLVLGSILQS